MKPPWGSDERRQLEEWIEKARAGCPESRAKVLETCRAYLLAIAGRNIAPDLKAKAGASDLVQDTFIEAHRDFQQFVGMTREDLQAWLKDMLLHNLGDFSRKFRETEKRQVDKERSLDHDKAFRHPENQPLDQAPTPSGYAIKGEEEQALRSSIAKLPENYRQVIEWHHREGRTYAEIGQLLGISAEAVRQMYYRALALLAQWMNNSK